MNRQETDISALDYNRLPRQPERPISANKIINSEKFPLNLAPFLFVRVGTFFTSLFT